MSENSWKCPYCGHSQVLQEDNNRKEAKSCELTFMSKYKTIGVQLLSIACLECEELTFKIDLKKVQYSTDPLEPRFMDSIKSWSLMPDSRAKPQPDYIPKPIIKDYEEACKIADSSPRASAILARRCLEAIIKDFCKIKNSKNLAEMIDQLKRATEIQGVTEESIEAIDHIRKQGNIAAHIQKPTNQMIDDISKEDSDLLIELLEMLFQEWYIDSYKKKERLKKIKK